MVTLAPVVLFAYNRLQHLKETVEALKEDSLAEQSDLIIYSDGPKSKSDLTLVREVREYLKTQRGFKSINIVESESNRGLAESVISGVTEVVNKYGKVIVLEDDLIVSPYFLRFMNHALDHFATEEKVMQVSGYMFNVDIEDETGMIFLPFTTSWGWATWKRAWSRFDPHPNGYEKLKEDSSLRYKFNLDGRYDYYQMLESCIKGEIDSWAIRWYLSVFLAGGLVLYPITSLVQNIGFDGSGTHCGSSASGFYGKIRSTRKNKNLSFPDLSVSEEGYHKVKLLLSSKRPIMDKLKGFVRKFTERDNS